MGRQRLELQFLLGIEKGRLVTQKHKRIEESTRMGQWTLLGQLNKWT